MELRDRAIVVVGGGRGIGRAHALACARAGAKVIIDDIGCDVHGAGSDPEIARAVATEIRDGGGFAIALEEDIGARGGPERLMERALRELGRIDGLIVAAGLVSDRTVMKMEDGELDRMLDVMVHGSFALLRTAGRAMIDAGGGSIVLHAAPVAFFGAARQSALSAASGAIAGLVRGAAIELRKHKVRVNAIAPTARTRTTEDLPLFRGISPESMSAEHIAPLALFLI